MGICFDTSLDNGDGQALVNSVFDLVKLSDEQQVDYFVQYHKNHRTCCWCEKGFKVSKGKGIHCSIDCFSKAQKRWTSLYAMNKADKYKECRRKMWSMRGKAKAKGIEFWLDIDRFLNNRTGGKVFRQNKDKGFIVWNIIESQA